MSGSMRVRRLVPLSAMGGEGASAGVRASVRVAPKAAVRDRGLDASAWAPTGSPAEPGPGRGAKGTARASGLMVRASLGLDPREPGEVAPRTTHRCMACRSGRRRLWQKQGGRARRASPCVCGRPAPAPRLGVWLALGQARGVTAAEAGLHAFERSRRKQTRLGFSLELASGLLASGLQPTRQSASAPSRNFWTLPQAGL